MTARIVSALVVAQIGVGFVTMAQAAEVKLTAASFQPESVVFAKHFYRWVRETNLRCVDKLAIDVLGPGAIEPQRQWHALQTGEVDMYFGPANYYRGAMPEGDVFNVMHNDQADQRRNGAWALLNAVHNERINAWYLTNLIAGVEFFVYTTKPATDGRFDGLRLRSVPLFENFLRSQGAQTTTMSAPALLEALEDGDIDGYVWPQWGFDVLGWQEFTRYRYGPGFMNTAAPVLVNLDRWNSLADDQRDCLSDMAVWLEAEWPAWRAAEDAAQLAALERAGIEQVDLGADFAERAEALHWAQLEQAEPEFVQRIRPLLTAGD
jgi:TRAP-type C4-dicarboxylate transport system substrate-binding protein